jgi:hypothetical protein
MQIGYMIHVRWLVRTSGFEVRGKVAISCSNVLFAECNILLLFLDISYEPNSYCIIILRNINSEASISYLPSLRGPLTYTEQDAVDKADAIILTKGFQTYLYIKDFFKKKENFFIDYVEKRRVRWVTFTGSTIHSFILKICV